MTSLNRLAPRAALVLTILAVNIGLDRLTKVLAVELLKGKEPVRLLWNSIVLVYAENTGAFLSLGHTWPDMAKLVIFLIVPSFLCLAAIVYCLTKETDPVRIGLMISIAAGGIANLYDRLMNSFHVIDFLNFGIGSLRTGILNVADLSVTLGALFFVFYEYRRKRSLRTP